MQKDAKSGLMRRGSVQLEKVALHLSSEGARRHDAVALAEDGLRDHEQALKQTGELQEACD